MSSPGAHTPNTPHSSCGALSPGRRSWLSRPSPRRTRAMVPHPRAVAVRRSAAPAPAQRATVGEERTGEAGEDPGRAEPDEQQEEEVAAGELGVGDRDEGQRQRDDRAEDKSEEGEAPVPRGAADPALVGQVPHAGDGRALLHGALGALRRGRGGGVGPVRTHVPNLPRPAARPPSPPTVQFSTPTARRHRENRGRTPERSARTPDARTAPVASASSQPVRPVARRRHVSMSVSTTFGGVPRVCRGPAIACTAAAGGTRTSTELPGEVAASSSRVNRTAVRTTRSEERRVGRGGRGRGSGEWVE